MGNRQSARSIQPFLYKYANELSFVETMNTALISTVVVEIDELPIVCKMYFDSPKVIDEIFHSVKEYIENMREMFDSNSHPNLLLYDSAHLRNNCIMMMRQYMCNNLRDRMIQKIPIIEKKWIAFQLICAVSQLHSKAVTHGDLKPENILLTSYDWLFVTDFLTVENVYCVSPKGDENQRFVNYKPTYVEEESWNLYNVFFGELDNNKMCYIAPERCISVDEYISKTSGDYSVQPSMDVFSVGCIIAEIFLDGKPLFDLARHQLYRKNQFNPKDILRFIGDEEIEALILEMIALDPQNRSSIDIYKDKWLESVFPKSFSCILYQLGAVILRENLLFPDERISMIRKYIDAAWVACFGEEISPQELVVPMNADIFEYLRFENFPNIITDLCPDFDCIINHKNNGERSITLVEIEDEKKKQNASDSAVVLVYMIGTMIQYCRYPDTKVLALEMLTSIGKKIREEYRLQYIVPFAVSCLKDAMCKVRISAIDCIIEVLKDCEIIEIKYTDYYVFDTYLLPLFSRMLDDENQAVQLKLIEILPNLVNIGKMFIASVNMHQQKITMLANDDIFELEIGEDQREETLFSQFDPDDDTFENNSCEAEDQFSPLRDSTVRFSQGEGEDDTNHQGDQPAEGEDLDTSKLELQRQIEEDMRMTEIAETVFEETKIPEAWSRTRFVTDEQKTRSILGLAYNIHLNETEYDLAYDQDQEKNIEAEIEQLKEKILEIVDKIIVEQDPKKNCVLMSNIEEIAEFLGEQINSERLLAYILSFPNIKDDMLTISTLRGLKVFSHYLPELEELKYILTSCDNLFYDPNEIIVLEAIKTVHYFAVNHRSVFDSNDQCLKITQKLIEFGMHPNEQIKHWAIVTFCEILKHKSVAYIYCNLFKKIKRYLIMPDLKMLSDPNSVKLYIQPQVSRFCFDLATNRFYFTSNKEVILSFQDKSALCLIQSMIDCIPKFLSSKSLTDQDLRYINYQITKARWKEDFDISPEECEQYVEKYYYPMKSIDLDIKSNESNYGVNHPQRKPNKSAYDVHHLEFYNSAKGLVLVDQHLLTGSSGESIIKRSADLGSSEDEGVISQWHPKGRLIDTIYPVNSNNDLPHPITTLVTSDNSENLISGSKDGMLHFFNLGYDRTEVSIECVESMFITDLEKPRQINSISVLNSDTTFCVGLDEGLLDIYSPHGSKNSTIAMIQRIACADKGSVCKTVSFSKDFSRENVFAYATQKGNVYTHDLRVKLDVNNYNIGLKFGIPTSMTTANMNGTHKIVVGTMGGFIHLYDVRYNVPMEIYEHSRNHPIFDMCMHYPSLSYKYKMFTEINETQNPHCLISSGGSVASYNQRSQNETPYMTHEVSFLDLYQGQMKAVFSVDDTTNVCDEPIEVSEFISHDPIALSRKPGSIKFRDSIYKSLTANYVTKVLCPTLPSMDKSAPYFISAGTDRKIRYWAICKDKTSNYYNISTPIVNESEYKEVYLGDVYCVQEKVTERPAEPANLVTGVSYSKKSRAVIANKSSLHPINAINEAMFPDSNGISSCQRFNPSEFIEYKGSEAATPNQEGTSKLEQRYPVENSAHQDAILDMTIAENPQLGAYLFTAGRDGVIKCFS
ncbi:unnamed protein product [Moneuplotes crassus]|uniref:non-specific serine/threonine protein kinase n=1 Tax=Euplotes crassus TaxID=5936 RepID=A0AAD1U335_EUPCR|nr:unnamed protein product [Moneuplotes crassus]